MIELDYDELKECYPRLQFFDGYLALYLLKYVDVGLYLENVTHKTYLEYLENEYNYHFADNPYEYLVEDLRKWIKNNPKYKRLIKKW